MMESSKTLLALLLVTLSTFVVVNCHSHSAGLQFGREAEDDTEFYKPPPHIHGKFAYVTWSKDKGYEIKIFAVGYTSPEVHALDWIAKARFQNMVNKTGWAFVEVETKPSWPDEMQTYAAGMAEGYLTRDLIYYHWQNVVERYCDEKPTVCKFVQKFVNQNLDWVNTSISKLRTSSSYWHQVHLIYQQQEGLKFGFRKAAEGTNMKISDFDFYLVNLGGDLDDLEKALNPKPTRSKYADPDQDGHCSLLIKNIKGRDLYTSHVTWAGYRTMLRIIKRYEFHVRTLPGKAGVFVPGVSISMSSYPGMLWSLDDFYTISSGLLVSETTIENFNNDLWRKVTPQNAVFTGIRVMAANRLAVDGRQWTKLFTLFNSGTYNNQWVVVNYNLFEPTKPIKQGVLWVLEQLPGLVVSKDVTNVLNQTGYWASYNVPYFRDIYDTSGYGKMQSKFGDYYSYTNTARAKIFARDQSKVEDVDSMMALMRYNDYKNDPLSKCDCNPPYSAVLAISSRGELNPENGTYPIPNLGHRTSGATDMKLTTLDLFLLQQFIAIGGPTYDPLPPFEWSKSGLNERHVGMPDKYQFEPIIHHWHWL